MFGLKTDWSLDIPSRYFILDDYLGNEARWCPGCGDHAVLTAVQRICRDEQIPPEETVVVSGIGCSSRFPHYMGTYGFHSLHGRALPVACGIKSRRPDLKVFVATGDGDCCSIGAGHWVHAVRYNMDMVVLLFDNNIYGLTKKQTSPTSKPGLATNTHPRGAWLPALNPTAATLGFTNVSFMAQTCDWIPAHLHAVLQAAYRHRGLSFVRIAQRCPQYTDKVFQEYVDNPDKVMILEHDNGVKLDPSLDRFYKTRMTHDPADIVEATAIAHREDVLPIGLFFWDPSRPCYDDFTQQGMDMTPEDKIRALNEEMDRFAV